ncbi:hypothetical protein EMWEY_00058580 [Eimeria maxima]|uniref:Uncharacterized protein n=1 Tax=Eimeria maxima TaxID=5804 RepID=U6M637_EIMMA|nr:hypothetical protein EMWEY_00058580 [Eimeria maxima]CDJ59677.1 hypothetical protein EMWEY_00058580 [Eimeria maxima]
MGGLFFGRWKWVGNASVSGAQWLGLCLEDSCFVGAWGFPHLYGVDGMPQNWALVKVRLWSGSALMLVGSACEVWYCDIHGDTKALAVEYVMLCRKGRSVVLRLAISVGCGSDTDCEGFELWQHVWEAGLWNAERCACGDLSGVASLVVLVLSLRSALTLDYAIGLDILDTFPILGNWMVMCGLFFGRWKWGTAMVSEFCATCDGDCQGDAQDMTCSSAYMVDRFCWGALRQAMWWVVFGTGITVTFMLAIEQWRDGDKEYVTVAYSVYSLFRRLTMGIAYDDGGDCEGFELWQHMWEAGFWNAAGDGWSD